MSLPAHRQLLQVGDGMANVLAMRAPTTTGPRLASRLRLLASRPRLIARPSTAARVVRCQAQQDPPPTGGAKEPTTSDAEEEEAPLWVRREEAKARAATESSGELPFGVYLLASSIIAIAAVSRPTHSINDAHPFLAFPRRC